MILDPSAEKGVFLATVGRVRNDRRTANVGKPRSTEKVGNKSEHGMVTVASDWPVGETIDRLQAPVIGAGSIDFKISKIAKVLLGRRAELGLVEQLVAEVRAGDRADIAGDGSAGDREDRASGRCGRPRRFRDAGVAGRGRCPTRLVRILAPESQQVTMPMGPGIARAHPPDGER
jgi:hypothetical protein